MNVNKFREQQHIVEGNWSNLKDAWHYVRTIFPKQRMVIAGGAVRDTLMGRIPAIKDIDVYIFAMKDPILDILSNYTVNFVESSEYEDDIQHLANLFQYGYPKIQIIVCPNYDTVNKLLDSFDWNINLCAYDGDKIISRFNHIHYPNTITLNTATEGNALRRLTRGYEFSNRFNMPLDLDSVIHLARLITANNPQNMSF